MATALTNAPKPTTTSTTPTTTTTATTTTTVSTTPLLTTTEESSGVSACVLASTLSATFVILFITIGVVIYFLYRRKKKKSPFSAEVNRNEDARLSNTPEQKTQTSFSRNEGFAPDIEYDVPPKREKPLPRKMGRNEEYHGTPRSQEDYSVPPSRNDNSMQPPLPPNVARKLQEEKEKESQQQDGPDSYYLDMDGINDAVYQNYRTSQDEIYVNN